MVPKSITNPIVVLWCLLVCFPGIAIGDFGDEKEECSNISRLRMLMLAPRAPQSSFRALVEPVDSCPNGSRRGASLQLNIDAGNLEEMNPNGIIAELNHNTVASTAAQPLLKAPERIPADCRAELTFIPDCIPGLTSVFDEEKIQLSLPKLRGRKILSEGEGFVGTVERLLDNQINAFGLDFDASYKSKSDPLLEKHPANYAWGDATNLGRHPFVKDPPDHIISFCLICQLGPDRGAQAIVEGVKVLKPGGDLRFVYAMHAKMSDVTNIHARMTQKAASTLKAKGVKFEVYSSKINLRFPDTDIERPFQFIMFHKLSSSEQPANLQLQCQAN